MQTIIVFMECTRRGHVGCYGYARDTTPFLDQVAKRGVRWENCEAAGSRTNETFPRIAPVLRAIYEGGTHTAYYSANSHPAGPQIAEAATVFKRYLPPELRFDRRPAGPVGAEMVEDFVRDFRGRDDFVGVLHFRESHTPYEPYQFLDEFLADDIYRAQRAKHGHLKVANLKHLERHFVLLEHDGEDSIPYPGRRPRHKDKRVGWSAAFYVAAYDGAIKVTDSLLPPLFDAFPKAAIYITADHGEALGEGKRWFKHTHGRFPELLRVPLVAQIPDAKPATVAAECTHMNMMASVAARHGVKAKGHPPLPMEG